jgi:hypothetical protein
MNKLFLILGLVCLIALPASAIAKTQPDAQELAQRVKAAGEYWKLTHTHDRIMETLQRVSTQLPPDKQKGFMARAGKYFGAKRMADIKKQWLAMTSQVFTAKELRALVNFYGSPEGMAIREKMPQLLAGNAKIMGKELTAFIKAEQARLAKEMTPPPAAPKGPAKAPDKTPKK